MTPRQASLLAYHEDVAHLACTGENNVLWVLDLTDPIATQLAEAHETPEAIALHREKQLAAGNIPALTLTTPFSTFNEYRTSVMEKPAMPPLPENTICIVVCTEERIIAAGIPKSLS